MIEIRQGGHAREGKRETEERQTEKREERQVVQAAPSEEETLRPKNFRQIGNPNGTMRIYVEDYVYTYLHSGANSVGEHRVCILVGEVRRDEQYQYIFVKGAADIEDTEFVGNTPVFTDQTRKKICKILKEYFEGDSLVGWYMDIKGSTPHIGPEIERIHRNFFGGKNKILFLVDSLNREEKLYSIENNSIWQKDGYYIYYEKNASMQEYMVKRRESKGSTGSMENVSDQVLQNYKKMILEKTELEPRHMKTRLAYVTVALLAVAVGALGINMVQSRLQMKSMEGAIEVLAQAGPWATETEQPVKQERIVVEEIGNNLTPLNTEQTIGAETNSNIMEGNELQATQGQEEQLLGMDAQEDGISATVEITGQQSAEANTTGEMSQQQTTEQSTTAETTQQNGTAETALQSVEQNSVQEEGEVAETGGVVNADSIAAQALRQGFYVVQPGENLAQIIRLIYGDTQRMDEVCRKNGITNSDQIFAGQRLELP